MPKLTLPAQLAEDLGCPEEHEVAVGTLGEVITALDREFPRLKELLVPGGRLRPGLAVIIDGVVSAGGLFTDLKETSEVFLLPAISGGSV